MWMMKLKRVIAKVEAAVIALAIDYVYKIVYMLHLKIFKTVSCFNYYQLQIKIIFIIITLKILWSHNTCEFYRTLLYLLLFHTLGQKQP
jgi:hypothetical protein